MNKSNLKELVNAVVLTHPKLKVSRAEIARALSALLRRLEVVSKNGWGAR